MRKSRNILVVMLVAFALCADRAAASATPSARPHIGQMTRQVVGQITRRFQRVVPAPKFVENRREGLTRVASDDVPADRPTGLHACESTPFQFRLPPPTL